LAQSVDFTLSFPLNWTPKPVFLAASLASLAHQQSALSLLGSQQTPQQQDNFQSPKFLAELLLLRSQQNSSTPQPSPAMPLPFPNGESLFGASNQSMLLDHSNQSLLNAVQLQQQKTAIDIIQKALEAIAVANQQPKTNGTIGQQQSVQMLSFPRAANGHIHQPPQQQQNSNFYLQQNGVMLNQLAQQPTLEQQLVREGETY
jgi:hypothetical protein